MRIAIQVFTTIFLVSMFLGSLLMMAVDFKKASDLDMIESNIFGKMVMSFAQDEIASPTTWRAAGYVWLLLGLASIAGIVATFLKKHTFGWAMGAGLIAFTVFALILQPSLEGSNGNDPKVTAMAIAFFGVIGMILLVLLHTVLKPKVSGVGAVRPLAE